MTQPTGPGPRPPVCACEPTIREGLAAAARLLAGAVFVDSFAGRDCVAFQRALALALDSRPILTDACLAPQILERDATIRGLTQRLVDATESVRRAEWARDEALKKLGALVSEKAQSPFAASEETQGAADLSGGSLVGLTIPPRENGR